MREAGHNPGYANTKGGTNVKNHMKNLPTFLNSQIGEHGYICIRNKKGGLVCEGKVNHLRTLSFSKILNDEGVKIQKAMLGESIFGKKCINLYVKI